MNAIYDSMLVNIGNGGQLSLDIFIFLLKKDEEMFFLSGQHRLGALKKLLDEKKVDRSTKIVCRILTYDGKQLPRSIFVAANNATHARGMGHIFETFFDNPDEQVCLPRARDSLCWNIGTSFLNYCISLSFNQNRLLLYLKKV